MNKRDEMNALDQAYDQGDIGMAEYEIRKAELLYRATEEGEDEMNHSETATLSWGKSVLVATSEEQLVELASQLRSMYPEDTDEQWATQQIDRQLEMMMSQSIQLLERPLNYLNGAIPKAIADLKKSMERNDGSEVADQVLQRRTSWVKQLKAQKEFTELQWGSESDLVQAKLAYKNYFGKQWVPYSANSAKKNAENVKQTAAAAEAAKLLEELSQ